MSDVDPDERNAFWSALADHPGDIVRMLVFADWLAERDHQPNVEFALRWMAFFGRRPVFRTDVRRRPWHWVFEGGRSDLARRISRTAPYAVLPRWLVRSQKKIGSPVWWRESITYADAVLSLADMLAPIRGGLGLAHAVPPVPEPKGIA